jgi:hypothetical protein
MSKPATKAAASVEAVSVTTVKNGFIVDAYLRDATNTRTVHTSLDDAIAAARAALTPKPTPKPAKKPAAKA